ncbi:MAG: hypothetical protein R2712_02985 [Vicinamibacterales bacterium]
MTIVILGAGDIGAAAAQRLAAAGIASRVVLVDDAAAVAAGKALDLAQAAPVDRYDTRLSGTGDVTAVAGAAVVVVADRAGDGEWSGEAGLSLLRTVAGYNQVAPIVMAGATQETLIDRGVAELGVPRQRLFGTAPEALRAAVVSLVALDAETAPADIELTVIGRAPGEIIVPWESASIAGRRAIDVLPPPAIVRIEGLLGRLWPPGPLALGGAAGHVIRSMLTRTPRVHPAGDHDRRRRAGRTLGNPARARGPARPAPRRTTAALCPRPGAARQRPRPVSVPCAAWRCSCWWWSAWAPRSHRRHPRPPDSWRTCGGCPPTSATGGATAAPDSNRPPTTSRRVPSGRADAGRQERRVRPALRTGSYASSRLPTPCLRSAPDQVPWPCGWDGTSTPFR